MNLFFRLILIPLGYIVAVLVAAGVIAGVEWVRAYPPVAGDPAALSMTALVVLRDFIFLYALIAWLAAVPALMVVAVAEIFSLRNALYFCGAGLAVSCAVGRLVDPASSPAIPTEPSLVAAAGLAGGLVYWLCAGLWSGVRRRTEPVPS